MFEGNASEAATLQEMLARFKAPERRPGIMDRGIATEAHIGWLVAHRYRYLVVSRERNRQFDAQQAVEVATHRTRRYGSSG